MTGTIGDGALGLKVRSGELTTNDTDAALLPGLWLPNPPVAFAPLIARHASASMDISDGFLGDLRKLAAGSDVGFDIPASRVPCRGRLQTLAENRPDILASALSGGDDYQFLFTVPQSRVARFVQEAQKGDIRVTSLGQANANAGVVAISGPDGAPLSLASESWNHF
ncbi:MAG: AIR synthase-related protein [Nitratireductor sp.]